VYPHFSTLKSPKLFVLPPGIPPNLMGLGVLPGTLLPTMRRVVAPQAHGRLVGGAERRFSIALSGWHRALTKTLSAKPTTTGCFMMWRTVPPSEPAPKSVT
jgi:hypothetical protein